MSGSIESLPKITVLISGNGSNLQALIDATNKGSLKAEISLVISSSSEAYGLTRASNAGIKTKVHSLNSYYRQLPKTEDAEEKKKLRAKAREDFNTDLLNLILEGKTGNEDPKIIVAGEFVKPQLIVCAGWMLILSKSFLTQLDKRSSIPIINLHPALPGQFEGINAIERSWTAAQAGEVDKTGIMIHKVIPEVDKGDPLLVKELEVIKGESLEKYEARVHAMEHIAIVEGTVKALKTLV